MIRHLVLAGLIGSAPMPALSAVAATIPFDGTASPSDRIVVTVAGQGPDVILVPGLASSAHVWDAVVAHLSPTHRLHVVQISGFAGVPAGANVSGPVLEPVVAALHDYIVAHHLQGAAVIGHSLGGTVALRLAATHPDAFGRIMLVDTLPYLGMMFGARMTVPLVRPQATILRDQMIATTQEEYAAGEQEQMARLVKSHDAAADAVYAAAASSDHRVVAQALYDGMLLDLRPDLPRIAVPVTILYPWDETSGAPQQMFDMLYMSAFAPLPHHRLERIEGSYHFIMIDQPAIFLEKVDAFLSE